MVLKLVKIQIGKMNAVNKIKFKEIPSNPTTKVLPKTEKFSRNWNCIIGLNNADSRVE